MVSCRSVLGLVAACVAAPAALGLVAHAPLPRAAVRPGCALSRPTLTPISMKLGGRFFGRLPGGRGGSSSKGPGKSPRFWGGFGSWNNGIFGGGNNKKPPAGPLGAAEGASPSDDDSDSSDDEKKGMWAAYESALEKNPILIKGLTSFVGFTIGDLLAQLFIEAKAPYDPLRTLRLASFGFLVHGTTSHWFYGKLDGYIPGTTASAVVTKVFIDQVLWNPIFGVMFFSYMGLFEGSGVQGTIAKVKRDLITQVTGSWTVWPLAHAINFKFIPTEQRVLYINVIQVFYNCFLSVIGNRKPPETETASVAVGPASFVSFLDMSSDPAETDAATTSSSDDEEEEASEEAAPAAAPEEEADKKEE